jgi:poly(beta-D-mannuronate) lyase
MRRGIVYAILSLCLAAPVGAWAGNGQTPSESMKLARPGMVLINPDARARQLRQADPVLARRYCPSPLQAIPPVDLSPLPRFQGGMLSSGLGDRSAMPFTGFVMSGAAAALAGDKASGDAAVEALARWAAANAVSELNDGGPDRINTNALFSARRMLLGLLPAWAILRHTNAPSEATAKSIESWLAQRVADSDVATGPIATRNQETALSNRNYHRLMREAVAMAHGALTGDAASFRRGPRALAGALREMRPDGSLPLETARGPRALWHQRIAVSTLLMIAEMGKVQGLDLYALEVDGKRLKRAVDFLLQAIVEPEALAPYAPERQDLAFAETKTDGRHQMAWFEAWHRRVGIDPMTTGELPASLFASRPLIDELAGGAATCLFAKV